ncbi:MAG TPA: polyprenyl synthetase family protein [Polyangiaceae bacterium]|nr:polyprenyl synthetase family protein [Polyangiaceae bacterium]
MTQSALEIDDRSALVSLLDKEASDSALALPDDIHVAPRFWNKALFGPLAEASRRPGKEFRGRLAQLAWALAGGRGHCPLELSAAVEALHLGSLIVDDIEDGSLTRRGRQALHVRVGLPLALNAGNWLYFWPSVLLERAGFEPVRLQALKAAVDRSVLRCHYGQALDLSLSVVELRQSEVRELVYATTRLKTGSLFELAAELGAIAAGAPAEVVRVLAELGRDLGVALQMLDDWTGVACERRRHKGHEDLRAARPSWPWAWLSEQLDDVSYVRLRVLSEAVMRSELDPEVLAEQFRTLLAEAPRLVIRAHVERSRAACHARFAGSPSLAELDAELTRLERFDG